MTATSSIFDRVIEAVGNDGPFQKRFNFIFNFVLVIFASMPYMNLVLALAVPDHWCAVPGRELTNYSLEQWKEIHIPMENDTRGKYSYSKCKMFNGSYTGPGERNVTIDCQHGWDFDTTWYQLTAPSQEAWVCDNTLHVTNSFVFGKMGEVIGTFIFGQLADIIGRRPVFYIAVLTITSGRLLTMVTSSWTSLFFLAAFIGSLPSTSVFQGPLVIAMEISKNEERAHIAMMQCLGWTVGLCLLPFIMWFVGDWATFMALTTLPCAIYLFSKNYLIESPRWLASKGKVQRCIGELEKIAVQNGRRLPEGVEIMLQKAAGHSENVYGVLALFSSWRLTKNTIMLIVGWTITNLVYIILTLNVNNLGGNPFLNYFWQNSAELPAYIIGKYASDRFGRRWTNIGAFAFTLAGCIPLLLIINDDDYAFAVMGLSVFLKFSISFAFYVVNLQALETYPTCVRQTGISIGGIVGNGFGIVGPYIVYVGNTVDASYPYILSAILCVIGVICGVFLPETLNQKLPETLAEAAAFGADQDYWGRVVEKKNNYTADYTVVSLKQ